LEASLHIQTARRAGKTILQNAYYTTPFKVANVTEDKSKQALRLMLMTSSPGILDGDVYDMKIGVAANCKLELQTQSFQRLFTMKAGASQTFEVRLEEGASFLYLPHPTVPHETSDFVAKNKIYLSAGCSLIWGEVLTCGRKLNGEEFKFTRYHNITEVFLSNKLVIKENLLLRPSFVDVSAIGQLEGYTHQASLIYINETAAVSTIVSELTDLLSTYKEIEFGVSALPVNGVIVRLLGYKGEQLHSIQKQIAAYLTTINDLKIQKDTEAGVYAS